MSRRRPFVTILATLGLVAACSGDAITSPPDQVRLDHDIVLRAESEVQTGDLVGPSVMVRTIFTNAGQASVTLQQGGCAVRLRASRAADGVLVFDETHLGVMCIENVRLVTLAPGRADTVLRSVPGSLFADQPTSQFRLEVLVSSALAGSSGRATVAAGTVRIP